LPAHESPAQFRLHPTDAPPICFRGRKLLSISSSQVRHYEVDPRWYDLTLYIDEGGKYYLEIAYRSQTTLENEKESPRLDVLQNSSMASLAESLAQFQFMRPVRLDYWGGGSYYGIVEASVMHFELVMTFSLTVSRFLQAIARKRWLLNPLF